MSNIHFSEAIPLFRHLKRVCCRRDTPVLEAFHTSTTAESLIEVYYHESTEYRRCMQRLSKPLAAIHPSVSPAETLRERLCQSVGFLSELAKS